MELTSKSWTSGEQCSRRFACRGSTGKLQVAHDVRVAGDRGAGLARAAPDRKCARCAAVMPRFTADQTEPTCLNRFLTGRSRVTWPPLRTGMSPVREVGRSDSINDEPRRAIAIAAPR